jgi:hypothetical protein
MLYNQIQRKGKVIESCGSSTTSNEMVNSIEYLSILLYSKDWWAFPQSQSLFYLDISPLIYLFVSSSSISPKFPLFNHKYIYCKRVNSYWYGGPHLISDFDFIISVCMLYILCAKCKFSLSIMLCQFIIINIINKNSLNINSFHPDWTKTWSPRAILFSDLLKFKQYFFN